ncbi:MAG TPA: hypothetical protein VGJ84_22180, partial [Polyangiaceae bacterium]
MSKPRILPFGTWESPIGADALARSGVRLGFPSFDREGSLFWVETRPAEQGRSVLVQRASDGTFHDLTPASLSVRSRVHEYGGMSYLIFGSEFFVVNFSDQQIWRVAGNSAPTPLTSAPEFRFAEMSMDAARRRLIAVGERHGTAREPQNLIVIIELSSGKVGALVTGRDFYAAPALSPDGKELAFLAWDHPHMPWDAAELWVADLDSGGSVQGMQHIAGGPEGSAFQPGWSNAGLLYFSLEVDGFWNLHRWMDQRVTRVMDLSAELGAPLWQLGTRVWDFHGKDTVGACFRNGLSELLRFHSDGQIESISRDWAHVGQLACSGDYLALIVGWAGGGSELALLNLATGKAETVRNAYLGLLLPEDTSVAEAVTFPTGDGELAHGFFYAPRNHGFAGPDGARPPL